MNGNKNVLQPTTIPSGIEIYIEREIFTMTPHHPPYNHHSNTHDVNNNEPTTTTTSTSSMSEGDDTLPMMAFYEDWWRTYQSQSSSSVPSPPPPPPALSVNSSSGSSNIIRDPTSQPQQQLFARWLSQYWSTQLEFHSLLDWNRTGINNNNNNSSKSVLLHRTRSHNATATYDHHPTTNTTTTNTSPTVTSTNPPPEDHHHRMVVNTAILQQLYRHYYDHHRSAVLHDDDNDGEDGTSTDATDAAGPVAVVVTSHDYGTSVTVSSVDEFFQEYPDCCTAPQQPPPPRCHDRYTTDVPDDDSSRTTASSDDVEEEEDHGQQHVIVGRCGNDPIEVDNDDDNNNPWVVSLPSSTHNNNNHTKKKNMSTQLQQHDRSHWNERSVTAITDSTASTKHIPSLNNGTTTQRQRISPTSIIMEPLRPPSAHVVVNDSAPVGSNSSNNGCSHLNPYHRMDRNRNTNHNNNVPQREGGMVPPPPPKPHVPPLQQHPTSFSSSWDDYGPTSLQNPFQTAREVAAAHLTTIQRQQPYHHSEYDDQSIPTNDGPYNDPICTTGSTSNIPYDDRNHRNQSTNQHVPHMWQATSANTTMVGHSDPSTKMNPYHPTPHQQQQLHHPPPPVPVIRESLKRKFQPPIKRDSNHHHHHTTAVDAQPTTTDSAPSNVSSSSRTRMGGSIQTVTTRRPQSQPPKMTASAASKTNGHHSDTADTTSDELPEELQIYGKELVMKIENEIMDQTTTTQDPITFHDIAGLHDQKQTVYEIVCWPMQRPDLFTGLRRAPNGLLLYGPPGTGKMSIFFLLFVSIVLSFLNQFVIVLVNFF
jgi:hypothetical protein